MNKKNESYIKIAKSYLATTRSHRERLEREANKAPQPVPVPVPEVKKEEKKEEMTLQPPSLAKISEECSARKNTTYSNRSHKEHSEIIPDPIPSEEKQERTIFKHGPDSKDFKFLQEFPEIFGSLVDDLKVKIDSNAK